MQYQLAKMYVPYISDITRQIEEVVKIFAMEKELRSIKNRGYFPVPQLAPGECKIGNNPGQRGTNERNR